MVRVVAGRLGQGIAWVWVAFTIFLFSWLFASSLKSNKIVLSQPWALPDGLHVENYLSAITVLNLGQATFNSIMVVGVSTAVIVALSAPAAYVLSRIGFRGVGFTTYLFIMGIGVPVQVLLIPFVFMLAGLHLNDNLFGLGLTYVSVSLPFTVFLLTGFFRSLPYELEESAAIDGAGPVRTFFSIMLPLARPGLVTAAILNCVLLWNEFLLALSIISDNSQYTLALALLNMYGSMRYTANWSGLFAGVIIIVIPMVLAYLWLSNRIIEGLTLGSGK
jgi:N-acetylglucosamine transport system permease protein